MLTHFSLHLSFCISRSEGESNVAFWKKRFVLCGMLAMGVVSGCIESQSNEQASQEIQALIPRAAGVDVDEFAKIAQAPTGPGFHSFSEKSLSVAS